MHVMRRFFLFNQTFLSVELLTIRLNRDNLKIYFYLCRCEIKSCRHIILD
jgi:hypothetical protein